MCTPKSTEPVGLVAEIEAHMLEGHDAGRRIKVAVTVEMLRYGQRDPLQQRTWMVI